MQRFQHLGLCVFSSLIIHLAFGQAAWADQIFTSLLPSSRAVQVGRMATAFYYVIPAAPGQSGQNCSIQLGTAIPADFFYQQIDLQTNQVVGERNPQFQLPAGGAAAFVLALTPNAPFPPTEVAFTTACTNTGAAPTFLKVNTLLLSANNEPSADIVTQAATVQNDGILHLDAEGKGAFATAISNVGEADLIAVQATATKPINDMHLEICKTNPNDGTCINGFAWGGENAVHTSPLSIGKGKSSSFAVRVDLPTNSQLAALWEDGSDGAVAQYTETCDYYRTIASLDALNHRIFVEFNDGDGIVRGRTSVALQGGAVPPACDLAAQPSPAPVIRLASYGRCGASDCIDIQGENFNKNTSVVRVADNVYRRESSSSHQPGTYTVFGSNRIEITLTRDDYYTLYANGISVSVENAATGASSGQYYLPYLQYIPPVPAP